MTAQQGPLDASQNAKTPPDAEAAPRVAPDAGDDGLTIEEFAEKYLLSEPEIWRRIRRGELLGRTQNGRLMIYPASSLAAALADLPPLPDSVVQPPPRAGATQEGGSFLALSGERGNSPELALLLDHLSLAKEENREILRLTQESLRRVGQLSDALVQMKDAVIEAKDAELQALRAQKAAEVASLKGQLATRDRELKRQQQHSEDLEMLMRTMAQQAPHDG